MKIIKYLNRNTDNNSNNKQDFLKSSTDINHKQINLPKLENVKQQDHLPMMTMIKNEISTIPGNY